MVSFGLREIFLVFMKLYTIFENFYEEEYLINS